jgi:hypothetical protein
MLTRIMQDSRYALRQLREDSCFAAVDHFASYHDNLMTLRGIERPIQVTAEVVSLALPPAPGVLREIGRDAREPRRLDDRSAVRIKF